jgi:PIN domain nuclease of toxin-antitoxin system
MIAYLDTNVVVWLSGGKRNRLTKEALRLVNRADLLLSPIAFFELEILYELKRTRLPARDLFEKVAHETGLRLCDLPFATVASAALVEGWTRDPFDRMIVAQAKANGFAWLITSDQQIPKHYPRAVW